MCLDLDDYPQYSNALSESFETKIKFKLRCCYGYSNTIKSYKNTSWVDKNTWENFKPLYQKHLKW